MINFERSIFVEIAPDITVRMVSKEDAILSKLLWISKGSERSKRDILIMLRNGAEVNHELINRLAGELEVNDIWQELKKQIINAK